MRISCFADEIAPALKDQFRVMQELGLRFMEVRTVDDIGVMELPLEVLREVRRQAEDRSIGITCVSSPIGKQPVAYPTALVLEQVKSAAERAHILGCLYIRIFSFFHVEGLSSEDAFTLSVEKLTLMTQEAQRSGVTLVMEGGHTTVGGTARDAVRLFEAVGNRHLRCAFDAGAFIGAGEHPFRHCLPLLLPYIEYLHIKDAKFGLSGRVVPGEGDAELEKILDAIRDTDWVLSLEPHLAYAGANRGFSGEEPFKRAHAAFIAMLKRLSIAYR